MELTILQAALLAMYYWFTTWAMPYSLNFSCALVTSLFCGMILGDVRTAVIIGASIQPMFLAFTMAGGTVVWDEPAATIGGCTITMVSGLPVENAVTIAVPLSLLCAQLHTIRRIVMVYPVQKADKYAETCNTKGITFMAVYLPQIIKFFIFAIPMFFALYFGAEAVGNFMNSLPVWITNALGATGKLLPALGFAMTLNVIGRPQFLPFFLGGFFLAQYSGLSGVPLALAGLFIAFLYYLILEATEKNQEQPSLDEGSQAAVEADREGKKLLTKKDITKLAIRWNIMSEMCNSFARLQSVGFCVAFIPILKKLYGNDKEEFSAALTRHLMFFNTEGIWGSVIHGIVAAMEEQRALGAPIPVEAITGIKTGLMGPFAGIGDTINWSTLKPLFLVLFLPFAAEGSFLGPVIYILTLGAVTFAENLIFIHTGYRMGTQAALSILEGGAINKFISCASVLGTFMMGGLSASMVSVYTSAQIPTGGEPMSIQSDILDAVAPGLLTLAAVLLVYKYLRGGHSLMRATFWLLGVGLVLGAIGIIGDGGFLIKPLVEAAA